jgi:GGDEF domain-containing protein
VEELGIPDLTTEQIETLCLNAENVARKHILAKVSFKLVEQLDITVEVEGAKPVSVTVEIGLVLSSKVQNFDAELLTKEAIRAAYRATDSYLRKLV